LDEDAEVRNISTPVVALFEAHMMLQWPWSPPYFLSVAKFSKTPNLPV
jgi:hypothetical protein